MNARYVHTMSVAGAIAAQALLFLGAGTANAVDPLPEPPSIGHRSATVAPHLNPPPSLRVALGGPDTKVGLGGPDTSPVH